MNKTEADLWLFDADLGFEIDLHSLDMNNETYPIHTVRKLYPFEKMEVQIELGVNIFDAYDDHVGIFTQSPESQTHLTVESV